MYTIHVDGKLLHSSTAQTEAQIALDVKPSLDIESAGSLSFILPPGNAMYDSIRRMKSIITTEQDGRIIFRGRVLDDEKDFYNQKTVYCEGDKSFLLDSLQEDKTFEGKVQAYFRQIISKHNEQVEPDKRFTVGVITAVDADKTYEASERSTAKSYLDTSSVIEKRLIAFYGGYIRTRTEGGTTYIDWLKEYTEDSGQSIRFAVNLLDLKDRMDASDVFTCLIPLGYSEIGDDGTYGDPVTISSVNGGKDYIEDSAAVALYGKIWRSKTWGNTKDPAKLKEKAEEYMKTGAALRTLTLTALDMHFVSGNASMIQIGTKVEIESEPHGLQLKMVCAKMDIDPDNPEKTVYTFGVKPRTLSEAVIRTEDNVNTVTGGGGHGGGGSGVQQELSEILRWARITVDNINANILLHAGSIDELTGEVNEAYLRIDGVNSRIDAYAKEINLNAEKINLIAEDIVNINKLFTGSAKATYIKTASLNADSANIDGMSYDGTYVSWKEATFLTSSTTLTVNSTGGTVTGVTMNKRTKTIHYLGTSSKDEELPEDEVTEE